MTESQLVMALCSLEIALDHPKHHGSIELEQQHLAFRLIQQPPFSCTDRSGIASLHGRC